MHIVHRPVKITDQSHRRSNGYPSSTNAKALSYGKTTAETKNFWLKPRQRPNTAGQETMDQILWMLKSRINVCRTKMRLTVRMQRNRTVRRLFLVTLLMSTCTMILVVFSWTRTWRTDDKHSATCYVKYKEPFHHDEFPLLCMFTTFKPITEKLPVNLRLLTYL